MVSRGGTGCAWARCQCVCVGPPVAIASQCIACMSVGTGTKRQRDGGGTERRRWRPEMYSLPAVGCVETHESKNSIFHFQITAAKRHAYTFAVIVILAFGAGPASWSERCMRTICRAPRSSIISSEPAKITKARTERSNDSCERAAGTPKSFSSCEGTKAARQQALWQSESSLSGVPASGLAQCARRRCRPCTVTPRACTSRRSDTSAP